VISVFHKVSETCSVVTTKQYSTSFSTAIRLLHADLRQPIYNIYGFVRFADEIVDTFHDYDKEQLLQEFKEATFLAIKRGISLNPVLHSFQQTVRKFNIGHHLIEAFFHSMEMDLHPREYDQESIGEYIYGSAEVVGLMCLCVFCEGDLKVYELLKGHARSLGAAFQKINFLRDLRADYQGLSRVYFPGIDLNNFSEEDKRKIEKGIQADFKDAYLGIVQLTLKSRFGVYVAYKYYHSLFNKIRKLKPSSVLKGRVRIPNHHKLMIVLRAGIKNQTGLIG
jgi:15-cis-phytoene synthase